MKTLLFSLVLLFSLSSHAQDTTFAGNVTAKALKVSGTSGTGFLELARQVGSPTAPSTQKMRVWFENTTVGNGQVDLIWQASTYKRYFRTPSLSGDRIYTFPDASGRVAFLDNPLFLQARIKSDGVAEYAIDVQNSSNTSLFRVARSGYIVHSVPTVDLAYQYLTPEEGGSIQIANAISTVCVYTSDTLANYTLLLPPAPLPGQLFRLATMTKANVTNFFIKDSQGSVVSKLCLNSTGGGEWIYTSGWSRVK